MLINVTDKQYQSLLSVVDVLRYNRDQLDCILNEGDFYQSTIGETITDEVLESLSTLLREISMKKQAIKPLETHHLLPDDLDLSDF